MSQLDTEQKEFLITQNALCRRPVDTIKAFKDRFGGDEISRSRVAYYDPTNAQGEEDLSQELKDLFWRIRDGYEKRARSVPIAVQTFRLEMLDEMLDHPLVKNFPTVRQGVLKQAAEEMGGKFNQRENGAKPDDVADYIRELVGGIKQSIVRAIPDPVEQQNVLEAVSQEVKRRLEEEE